MSKTDLSVLYEAIRDIPDFPNPGIVFKDITPLLLDGKLFEDVVSRMTEACVSMGADKILAIESRGFIFGAPVAARMGKGLALARKSGKLPWKRHRVEYQLEYGTDAIEVHQDAICANESVVIIDDVLATGGTAQAATEVIQKAGGTIAGYIFLIELGFLGGRNKLSASGTRIRSLLEYD